MLFFNRQYKCADVSQSLFCVDCGTFFCSFCEKVLPLQMKLDVFQMKLDAFQMKPSQ